ncbi:ABC transporter substrate-binding protein [Nocardioides campestrisoli]|uniref:ABC transporter substrate-binding protein n=1 Tax=Nocardioides campestrisoli TaxID=2736757 RepID=UPI00163DD938|nr:ABC transporter substrate-binding protein [Nocardioides campestrisoli]
MSRWRPWAVGVASGLLLTACTGSGDPEDADEGAGAPGSSASRIADLRGPARPVEGAVSGGSLTVHLPGEPGPTSLDPAGLGQGQARAIMQALTQRSLTQYVRGEDGTPVLVPDLATDLGRPNEDHTEWRFTVRDGVTWEDGSAVTPGQVAFGITRTLDVKAFPLGPGADYTRPYFAGGTQGRSTEQQGKQGKKAKKAEKAPFTGVRVEGRDVVLTTTEPYPEMDRLVSLPGFGPVPEGKVSDPPGYGRKPWATGPYRVKRLVPGKRLVLVTNGQWQPDSDPGRHQYLDRWVFRFDRTQAQVDRLVLDGGKRARHTVATVSGHAYPEAAPALGDRLVPQAAPCVSTLAPDHTKITDLAVRRALALAYPYEEAWLAAGEVPGITRMHADSLVPPWFPGKQDRDAVDAGEGSWPRTDPERARELLAEAGHEPGDYELTMLVHEDDPRAVAVQARVTRALRRGGFAVRVLPVAESPYNVWGEPKSPLDKKLNVRAVSLCADWPSGSGLVEPLLRAGSDYNTARFAEESVEQELDRIAALPPTEQDEAWAELDERASAEQLPFVPTGFRRELLAFGQGVGNPTGEAASGAPNYRDLYVVQ